MQMQIPKQKVRVNIKTESFIVKGTVYTMVDSRAPEEFADTIRASYEPEEFRELLIKAGSKRTNAIMAVKGIFKSVKK